MLELRPLENASERRDADLLLAPHFRHLTDERTARWEWDESPLGSLRLGAFVEGRLLGHYGLIRYSMSWNGRKVPGGKLEGSLVDGKALVEAARRTGNRDIKRTFRLLVEQMIRRLREEKELLVFGFPNEAAMKVQTEDAYPFVDIPLRVFTSVPSLMFSHRERIEKSSRFSRLLTRFNLTPLRPALASLGALSLSARDLIRRNLDGLFTGSESTLPISPVDPCNLDSLPEMQPAANIGATLYRDTSFLRWRFASNPVARSTIYRLGTPAAEIGWFAISVKEGVMTLEDHVFLNNPEAGATTIARSLDRLARESGCSRVEAIVQEKPGNDSLLRALRSGSLRFIETRILKRMIYLSCPERHELSSANAWSITRAFWEGV